MPSAMSPSWMSSSWGPAMANPWHHAVSSARKHGGVPEDYLAIHEWFDASKAHMSDFRHRALRHHAQGIFWCVEVFGPTIALSTCKTCGGSEDEHEHSECPGFEPKVIPTRWIGEQHVNEDLGRIPILADWFRTIQPEKWMNRSRRLSVELEQTEEALA